MARTILWLRSCALHLVADAKYKRLAAVGFQHADLYQMHAYCTATNLPGGLLIYGEGATTPKRHQIRETDRVISVVAVNLGGGPDDIRVSIAAVAAEARYLADISSTRRT